MKKFISLFISFLFLLGMLAWAQQEDLEKLKFTEMDLQNLRQTYRSTRGLPLSIPSKTRLTTNTYVKWPVYTQPIQPMYRLFSPDIKPIGEVRVLSQACHSPVVEIRPGEAVDLERVDEETRQKAQKEGRIKEATIFSFQCAIFPTPEAALYSVRRAVIIQAMIAYENKLDEVTIQVSDRCAYFYLGRVGGFFSGPSEEETLALLRSIIAKIKAAGLDK